MRSISSCDIFQTSTLMLLLLKQFPLRVFVEYNALWSKNSSCPGGFVRLAHLQDHGCSLTGHELPWFLNPTIVKTRAIFRTKPAVSGTTVSSCLLTLICSIQEMFHLQSRPGMHKPSSKHSAVDRCTYAPQSPQTVVHLADPRIVTNCIDLITK